MRLLLANWQVLSALVAATWAILTFVLTRRRDLAWKRTEFIIQQSQYLDTDPEMRACTLMVYGKHPTLSVADFLKADADPHPSPDAAELVIRFEKYLNVLWRLAYAHLVLGTLTKRDLVAFGAYFDAARENADLQRYCLRGYRELVTVARLRGKRGP